MTDISREDALAHFGVKGMRWGVRNDRSGTSNKAKQEKMSKVTDSRGNAVTKADAKWATKAGSTRKGFKAYDTAAAKMNSTHIPAINSKPEYKNTNMLDPKNKKIAAKYEAEYMSTFTKEFDAALKTEFGSSPSGTYKVIADPDAPGTMAWKVEYTEKLKHEDFQILIRPVWKDGLIVRFDVGEDSVSHGDIAREDALAHFGVKGMRWGVRKAYVSRLRKEADYYEKVAKGGNLVKTMHAGLDFTMTEMAVNGGVSGAALKRAETNTHFANRVERGRLDVFEKIIYYSTIQPIDLIEGSRKPPSKRK